MNGFDTPINILLIFIWLALAIFVGFWSYYKFRAIIRTYQLWILITLRLTSLVLISIFLFQPYSLEEKPNADSFKTIVLSDCSASMNTVDCNGRARIDVLKNILTMHDEGSLIPPENKSEAFILSNEIHTYRKGSVPILPGNSSLGEIVKDVAEQESDIKTAAIVLLSDGHTNEGQSLIQAAKYCRQRNIPINCIGIGEQVELSDISLITQDSPIKCTKKELTELPFRMKNSFNEEKTIVVELLEGDELVQKKNVVIAANSERKNLSFTVTPFKAGFKSYRIRTNSVPEDQKPETDVAYLSVEVKEPDSFNILYLGASLNWNFKFLKIHANNNEQFNLNAIVKTGENRFLTSGDFEKEQSSFPKNNDFLNTFDIVVLDTRAITIFEKETVDSLVNFVSNRGGGLLFLGPTEHINNDLKQLLPVKSTSEFTAYDKKYLEVASTTIFPEASTELLQSEFALAIPTGTKTYKSSDLKPGTRSGLNIKDTEESIMPTQQYGGGHIAYLGTESSWQWHMASDVDMNRYTSFWNNLFVWLGSTGKPRTKLPFNASKVSIDEEMMLTAVVYDNNYRPAYNADVSIIITNPNGETSEIAMAPSPETPGKFTAPFIPRTNGEFKALLTAEFGENNSIAKPAFFLASPTSSERLNTQYKGDVLRDAARITGGTYTHYKKIKFPLDINLSDKVPVKTSKKYWSSSWLLLIMLLLTLGAEWILKRNIGMR